MSPAVMRASMLRRSAGEVEHEAYTGSHADGRGNEPPTRWPGMGDTEPATDREMYR